MVCVGLGLGAAGKALAVWMGLEILVTTWQPDRSHVFGPRRLPELSRPVDIQPQHFFPLLSHGT